MNKTYRPERSAGFREERRMTRRGDRDESLEKRLNAEHCETRRAAIRGIGRWLLASLSLGGIAALARRPKTTCDLRVICRNCSIFEGCEFPQARKARSDERTGGE